jgi:hypothetical protein
VIDYLLTRIPTGPVVLEIADAEGTIVRSFQSGEPAARPPASRYFDEDWLQPPAVLPAHAGHNRFVWDLRLPRPRATEYEFSIAAVPGADTPALPQGIFVLPGRYEVRLTAAGKTLRQPLEVGADPRAPIARKTLEAQLAFYRDVVRALESATDARAEIDALAGPKPSSELERFLKGTSEDNIGAIGGVLGSLATDLEGADAAPTRSQIDLFEDYGRRLRTALEHWRAFRARAQGTQTMR